MGNKYSFFLYVRHLNWQILGLVKSVIKLVVLCWELKIICRQKSLEIKRMVFRLICGHLVSYFISCLIWSFHSVNFLSYKLEINPHA